MYEFKFLIVAPNQFITSMEKRLAESNQFDKAIMTSISSIVYYAMMVIGLKKVLNK